MDSPSEASPNNLALVVLVGRARMAKETVQDLLRLSALANSSPIFLFYLPGALTEGEARDFESLSPNIIAQPTTLPLPRYARAEMFYSRNSRYARRFGKSRVGYLDMCYWRTNLFAEPALSSFELIWNFDDDSDFRESPDCAIQNALNQSGWVVASAGLTTTLGKNNWDVRQNFFNFTESYVERFAVKVCDSDMSTTLRNEDEVAFHSLPRTLGNFDLYRAGFFRTADWYRWVYAVNLYGGSHRFRWGDIIVINAFARMQAKNSLFDLGLCDSGGYAQAKVGSTPIRGGPARLAWKLWYSWKRNFRRFSPSQGSR